MLLLGTLLVRNEEDIVKANLDHHVAQGVEAFIVTVNASEDCTSEIVRSHPAVAHVIDEPALNFCQGEWVTRMARLAATFHAQWVVHLDADEFWYGLRSVAKIPADVGIVWVKEPSILDHRPILGCMYPDRFDSRLLPWYREKRNPGRLLHRNRPGLTIAQGNHSVSPVIGKTIDTDQIRIHHYPLRSFSHAVKKAKQAEAYQNYPGPQNHGFHWRDMHASWKRGQLRNWYDAQCFRPNDGTVKFFSPFSSERSAMTLAELIPVLRNFSKIMVTGPARSGTTIATHILAQELGFDCLPEEEFGTIDMTRFVQLYSSRDRFVVQAPAMSPHAAHFPGAVVFMRRPVAEIIRSQKRVGWNEEQDALARYFRTEGSIALVKQDAWELFQRPRLGNRAFELEYRSLEGHSLWVPDEQRQNFTVRQTRPNP